MRTLIVNLTRFGDLLQTQPVFNGLRQAGDTVSLVCLQNFQPATALMRNLDKSFAIPGASLLALMDKGWPQALGRCLEFVDHVRRDFVPQRVINLTSSLPARLLAKALSDGPVLGFGLDDAGYGAYSSPWAAFLEATSLHRGASPFNIVDLFLKAAHLGDAPRDFRLACPEPDSVRRVAERVKALADVVHNGWIGIQLGASAAKRRWPAEHFARVAGALWRECGLLPVLLGSRDEIPLAAEFAAVCGCPHASLVGETGLTDLAAAVSGLRLLLTNDTGTMHLAAGLGVPVLAVFLATAQPWDTGPYLAGCCAVEPDMDCHPCSYSHQCGTDWSCRGAVRPEAVLTLARGYLRDGVWPRVEGLGLRAWQAQAGPEGFLDLESLSGHQADCRAAWNAVQRQGLRRFLDGQGQLDPPPAARHLPEDFRAGLAPVLAQALSLLELLEQQGRVLLSVPRSPMRAKFMASWQRVESLLASHPALCALGHLWLHLSQHESGGLPRFLEFAQQTRALLAYFSSCLSVRP